MVGGFTEFFGCPNFFDPPELLFSDAYEDFCFIEFLLLSLIFEAPMDALLSFVLLYSAWTFPLRPREELDPPNIFLLNLGDPFISYAALISIVDVL